MLGDQNAFYTSVLTFLTFVYSGIGFGLPGTSIDFKDWAQCPGYEDKTAVNITNVFIDHLMNAVKVSCDMDVQRDFGLEEFSMVVDIAGKDDATKKYIHEQNVDQDGICKSLEDPKSIISVAFELMGFPKGTKCPIKKNVYQMKEKKIDIPAIAMLIFGKKKYWRIDIKFVTGDTAKHDAPVEMCLRVYLERKDAATKERSSRKNQWG